MSALDMDGAVSLCSPICETEEFQVSRSHGLPPKDKTTTRPLGQVRAVRQCDQEHNVRRQRHGFLEPRRGAPWALGHLREEEEDEGSCGDLGSAPLSGRQEGRRMDDHWVGADFHPLDLESEPV